jgi:uncharacterized membrane protein YraQ (UPF0718 family)
VSDGCAAGHHHAPRSTAVGHAIRAGFLAIATIMVAFGREDPLVGTFALSFVGIVLEAIPFMLLGSLVSGLVEEFVRKDRLAAILPRRRLLTTLLAATAGLVFPVCECAIVPVVRRFLRKGVPLSAAVAYLLAGPIFNPIVAASTGVAYAGGGTAWAMIAIRLSAGLVVAVVVGSLVGRAGEAALAPGAIGTSSGDRDAGAGEPVSRRLLAACRHGADEFLDVGQYLVMGAFVAGLAQTAIHRESFLALAATPPLAVLLMMGMAILLNLCSEADAFVAASFRATLPMSAQMGFLVLGPMLDLKLLAMYLGVFRKRFIVVLAGLVALAVFAAMGVLQVAGLDAWFAARGVGPGGAP